MVKHNYGIRKKRTPHPVLVVMKCLLTYVGTSSKSKGSDSDSDDEWPTLETAAAMAKEDYCKEVIVNPEDEKAIDMFMSKNPPL
eukprot:g33098.t1